MQKVIPTVIPILNLNAFFEIPIQLNIRHFNSENDKMVELLLANGAIIDLQDKNNQTALHIAVDTSGF